MIEHALSYVEAILNEYLMNQHGVQEKIVVLSNIGGKDDGDTVHNQNKVLMSLVNLEQDDAIRNLSPHERSNFSQPTPTIHVNCYLLIAAKFKNANYKEGLKYLSSILTFFHTNPQFARDNAGNLDTSIDKLMFEISNQGFEELNNMWSAIGSAYMPSLLIKMRILSITDSNVKEERPSITSLDHDVDAR